MLYDMIYVKTHKYEWHLAIISTKKKTIKRNFNDLIVTVPFLSDGQIYL